MAPILLFDFDGTIADTYDLSLSIAKKISGSLRTPALTEEEIVRFRTIPFRDAVRGLKIPLRKIPALLLKIRREIREHIEEIRPFDGIAEALAGVRSTCGLMGMVTSNSEENVSRFLKKYGLDFFNFGAYSTAIFGKASKLRALIHKHRLPKERVVYIGDTTGDIEASRTAGIRVAAVAWGYNTRDALAGLKPDFLLSKPEDLILLAGGEGDRVPPPGSFNA